MAKVVFDTNAYRNLVSGRSFEEIDELIKDVKAKEAANGIETLLNPIVAQELLFHLADRNDPAFERCLKANKALYLHNGTKEAANVFPTFDVLLAKIYFHQLPAKRLQTYDAIIQMSYHLAVNPSDENFAIFENNLIKLKASVELGEAGFIDGLFNFVRITDPLATDWMPFRNDSVKRQALLASLRTQEASRQIAKGYVFMAHMALIENGFETIYNTDQINQMADSVALAFPEPIALFKNVIENLTNSEFPLDEASRANFVWDIALMFGAGKHNITNDKLYFITADKAIIRTAIEQGARASILTLDEYLEYINHR